MKMQKTRSWLALAMCAPLLISCAGNPIREGPTDAGAQGMSSARLAQIGQAMNTQVAKGVFPGAVSVVARDGKVVHFEAHGFLDATKTKPMARDAIFRLASMTKPITSVATMMLVERGELQLNDPIAKWLPELKDLKVEAAGGDVAPTRAPTVQDLLRHTAGLVYKGSTRSTRIRDMYEQLNIETAETDLPNEQFLKNLGSIPLAHQPGTFWEYSIATDVLGLVVERVAGKTLDRVFDEMILQPLGMKDTAFWVPADKRARLAETLDSDAQKTPMLKAYRQFENPAGKSYLKGGAGLVGTADDYLKFLQMIANGGEANGKRYLSKKTIEFMFSDHTLGMGGTTMASTGPGYGFGLGFAVRRQDGMAWVPGSTGDGMWAGAWGTSFWIDPKERLVGILMSQSPSNRVYTRMLFKNLVYGAMVQ